MKKQYYKVTKIEENYSILVRCDYESEVSYLAMEFFRDSGMECYDDEDFVVENVKSINTSEYDFKYIVEFDKEDSCEYIAIKKVFNRKAV